MKKSNVLLFIVFAFLSFSASAMDILLPKPQKYKLSNDWFVLDNVKLSTSIMEKEWRSRSIGKVDVCLPLPWSIWMDGKR